MKNPKPSITIDLLPAIRFILAVGFFVWLPAVYVVSGLTPIHIFDSIKSIIAVVMFLFGAIIANSTAIGGGIVFNPTSQLVFGLSGFSALALSITVQCAGMSSGTYGWYKKGEYGRVLRRDLALMVFVCVICTVGSVFVFLLLKARVPADLLKIMKMASALISFYVAGIMWKEIGAEKTARNSAHFNIGPSGSQIPKPTEAADRLRVDWRIYPWIALGALLNVHTAVGAGELAFSHLIKYYKATAKQAVAVGVLIQAVSVIIQTLFILLYLQEYLIIHMVWIGLLFTMAGGRLAPFLITRPWIEPYLKHVLGLTALTMGITSLVML